MNGSHSTNGIAEPPKEEKAPLNLRQKIQGVPLRSILLFFGTLLIIGIFRRGWLAAVWVLGWASFFAGKLLVGVKKKVDEKRAQA